MYWISTLTQYFNLSKKESVLLVLFFILTVLVRVGYIWDNNIHFYFDQSRDAYESLQIYQKGDIKIQGPSASGTGDAIYHGVLYYYIIGLFYFIGGGSPFIANVGLILISSSVVFPVFLLTKKMFNSMVAFISIGLISASAEAIMFGVALSNTTLLIPLVAWLYYLAWRVFAEDNHRLLPVLAVVLGLCHQSAIFTLYLVFNLGIFYLYSSYRQRRILFYKPKTIVFSGIAYIATISTMILTQFKLWRAGIFQPFQLASDLHSAKSITSTLTDIFNYYVPKLSHIFLPTMEHAGLALAIGVLFTAILIRLNSKKIWLLLLWFFSPIWLIVLTSKGSYHISVATSAAFYILLAVVLEDHRSKQTGRFLIGGILCLFIVSNLHQLAVYRGIGEDKLSVQSGGMLKQQLLLIDTSYQIANQEGFSIASLTAPYGYNTTWSYLYGWYGLKEYGYKPNWFGPDQTGIHAGNILENTQQPLNLHFTIYEPDPGSPEYIREEFVQIQDDYNGTPDETYRFDKLVLEKRRKE